jgi:hypothetical protein
MTASDQKLSDFFLKSSQVDEELELTRDKSAIGDEKVFAGSGVTIVNPWNE